MADYNKNQERFNKQPVSPGHPPRIISDSMQALRRESIGQANQQGRYITLERLSDDLKNHGNSQNFSLRTLGRTLDTFGQGRRSEHLKEKDHVLSARRRSLREKRLNRKGETGLRPAVYLDESYVNKNHSNDLTWYLDEDGLWVQKPTGKRERLIIINALTKEGWIPGTQLVFKSYRKTGDYHRSRNQKRFNKWFGNPLLLNILQNSLIIMDNASYHNSLSEHSAPISTSKKEEISTWLMKNGIPTQDDGLKVE